MIPYLFDISTIILLGFIFLRSSHINLFNCIFRHEIFVMKSIVFALYLLKYKIISYSFFEENIASNSNKYINSIFDFYEI